MTLQVLIATMHQTDHSLLEKMNIQSDAIVVNQCDYDKIERFSYKGHSIVWMSLAERGIGLSRNTALMRSTADIVLFADEDVRYTDGYPQIIQSAFENNQKAGILLFDLKAIGSAPSKKRPYASRRIRWYNSMNYGAVHFACRRERIFANGLSYNLLFGGGAKYSCGEDNIFMVESLRAGLKVWTVPGYIGTVTHGESTWFQGYTDKYFYDKGVLMGTAFGWKAYPLSVALLLKNGAQTKEYGFKNAIKKVFAGIKQK